MKYLPSRPNGRSQPPNSGMFNLLKQLLEMHSGTNVNDSLAQTLGTFANRLYRLKKLIGRLGEDVNAVRQDTLKSVDEKFGLVCDVLFLIGGLATTLRYRCPDRARL
jgi:hypothetical protein